jgi:hypothetical protein
MTGQHWDLEGFFLKGTTLTAVGGFNFLEGQGDFGAGDILIDNPGDAEFGPENDKSGHGYTDVKNTFGYDYVFDLNLQDGTYNVYSLSDASVTTVWYWQNAESNPFRYAGGGNLIGSGAYTTGLTDDEVDRLGGSHNALSVDLGFLSPGTEFTAHLALGCGNDNLMGAGSTPPVPEPSTVLLLGAGLIGLVGLGRKKARRN